MNMEFWRSRLVVRAISKLNAITRLRYDDMISCPARLENESARLVEQNQVLPSLKMKLKTRLLFRPGYWKFSPLTQLIRNANLIRVGDPNQAINSTFTPADPIYFRRFCEDCNTQSRLATMDQAGRSTRIIIEAANFALDWVNRSYASSPFVPRKFGLLTLTIPNSMPTLSGSRADNTPRHSSHRPVDESG